MKQEDILNDLSHIRSLMERSNKFISISGVSGILIGLYALAALIFLFIKLKITFVTFGGINSGASLMSFSSENPSVVRLTYIYTAIILLILSLGTGVILARKKAKENGQSIWNLSSKSLLLSVSGPLISGGIFAIVATQKGVFEVIVPTFLIFYGLALFSGGTFTFKEIRILGILQVVLGLLAFVYAPYSLLFFGMGFGILHIIYGIVIMKKYGA